MHDGYFEAAFYLDKVLGAGASRYFDKLRRLSRSQSLDSLIATINQWAGIPVALAPVAPAPTPSEKWVPCSHWTGGDRKCATCEKHAAAVAEAVSHAETVADAAQIEADLAHKVHGTMRRAQDMYLNFRPFVQKRMHAECDKHTGGTQYNLFDDVESLVWQNVAARIETYKDQGLKRGAMAWLKAVVYSTVSDHFRAQYQDKRDVRKEAALGAEETVTDPSAPFVTIHASPTRPEGAGVDPDEVSVSAAMQRACLR